jgi:D-mannonate dehydratase
MYVSGYIHPKWFESEGDRDLHYLKQIGIDYIDVSLDLIEGYEETGIFERSDLQGLVDRLDKIGLKIERITARGHVTEEAPGDEFDLNKEIDNYCRMTEIVGDVGIRVMLPVSPALERTQRQGAGMGSGFFQGQYGGELIDPGMSGWEVRTGRGGYSFPAYTHAADEEVDGGSAEEETFEQLWEEMVSFYKILMPVAESAGILMAQHGADPPISPLRGVPQILSNVADFDRLFREVPSPNNGMTFCVGTRYESGEDVFEAIKHFGSQNRIFHVHFRNVRGTLPKDGGYEERFTDDGDLNMMDVVRALNDVGYDRALDYDHVVQTNGDSYIGRQSAAFSAGYIRGLLAGL